MDSNLSIIKYYKKHIFFLKDMLNNLVPLSDDLTPLIEIQRYIIDRILDSERKIKNKKNEVGKLKQSLRNRNANKERAKEIKLKISKANDSINGYKYLLYLWRCFGDGIAFKYINKWNLKRLLYESDSSEVKQTSGFIGGKTGIETEWKVLKDAVKHNVPAILCDITNSIRHGDICLLGASDPFVIEVKSSSNKNKRIERQLDSIHKIHNYLENDMGDISGFNDMKRLEVPIEETHHNDSINNVISSAKKGCHTRVSPEPGLYYFGFNVGKSVDYDAFFNGINEPIVFMLNEAKTNKRWDNYYPFTLSIKSAESLYSFIKGEVYLSVVLDGSVMKAMAKSIGYDLDIIMSENVGFKYTKNIEGFDEPLISIASEHYVGRLGLEFLSLEWFFKKEEFMLADIEKHLIK